MTTSMQVTHVRAFVVIQGTPFQVTQYSAGGCLRTLSAMIRTAKDLDVTFTFQPSSGFIYAKPGDASVPVGILYEKGYVS